jgi:hypothetical protein
MYEEDEFVTTVDLSEFKVENTCQNPQYLSRDMMNYASKIRREMKGWVDKSLPTQR